MTWAEAFLLQACSDFAIFKSLSRTPDTPECHRLNAEYPWEDGQGTLLCPHAYTYPEFRKMQPQYLKFLKLMDHLFQNAESKSGG